MTKRKQPSRGYVLLIGAVAGVSLLAAACGGGGNAATPTAGQPAQPSATSTPTTAPAADPTTTASPEPQARQIDFASPSTLDEADPEFSYSAMVWQGYWISRDQFGPLTLGSGLGVPFAPPMDMIQMAMQMVAANPDDQPFMPQNPAPLQAIYRSGSPALAQDMTAFTPDDFAGMRLDPASFENVVGVAGQAQLMLKESQWARNFHTQSHFGSPESDFGAQQRFMGMMVSMLAQMQGQYAMENLLNMEDGLYYDSDGALDFVANWVMLQALADIAGITGDESLRYMDPMSADMFGTAAQSLYEALAEREPADSFEAAAATRALAYHAWTTSDDGVRTGALARIDEIVDGLGAVESEVSANAAQLVAFVAANQATGADTTTPITALLEELSSQFNPATGTFDGKPAYSTSDVAWIIGGLNSVAIAGPVELRAEAAEILTAFYEATLDKGGMQLSAPPGKDGAMAGEFEKDLPSEVYYHGRNVPPPPMAGGEFGMLTLPAGEITFSDGSWTVTDGRFYSGPGMHLANELNWLGPHLGSLPFPPLREDASAATPGGSTAGTAITVTASNTAFDTTSISAPLGEEIELTFVNDDAEVPHNFHLSGPGGFDVRTEIFTGDQAGSETLTFTLPEAGEYTFVCDVHPAQMTGTLTAE